MKKLVETHPGLPRLPQRIKSRLAFLPTSWSSLPANRRNRKRMERDGFIVNMLACENSGFTLARAWHQQGGEVSALLELDIRRGSHHDLSTDVGPYAALIRAALENKLLAIIGGPNCRSRSVSRPCEVWGTKLSTTSQVLGGRRIWNQWAEAEKAMIQKDDILLWRMIFLAMVSNYIKEARQDPNPVGFTLEQPASPRDYKPEVVSF